MFLHCCSCLNDVMCYSVRAVTLSKLCADSSLGKMSNSKEGAAASLAPPKASELFVARSCLQTAPPEAASRPNTDTAAGAAPLWAAASATEGRRKRKQILLLHFAVLCRLIASPKPQRKPPWVAEGAALHLLWVAECKRSCLKGIAGAQALLLADGAPCAGVLAGGGGRCCVAASHQLSHVAYPVVPVNPQTRGHQNRLLSLESGNGHSQGFENITAVLKSIGKSNPMRGMVWEGLDAQRRGKSMNSGYQPQPYPPHPGSAELGRARS